MQVVRDTKGSDDVLLSLCLTLIIRQLSFKAGQATSQTMRPQFADSLNGLIKPLTQLTPDASLLIFNFDRARDAIYLLSFDGERAHALPR